MSNSRVVYLELFYPISDATLMLDAPDPFTLFVMDIECLSIRSKLLIPSFDSLEVFFVLQNSRDTLCLVHSDNLG